MHNNIRIFVASPSDVNKERRIAKKVLDDLKQMYKNSVEIESILWEYEPTEYGKTIQEQIPLPSECDIVVVILWSRLGTKPPENWRKKPKDNSSYQSYTEYEFEVAYNSYKEKGSPKIYLYYKTAPLPYIEGEDGMPEQKRQQEALSSFLNTWYDETKNSRKDFKTTDEFEEIFRENMEKLIKKHLSVFESKSGTK